MAAQEKFMVMAINQAIEGKTPFGAVLVNRGQVFAAAYNTVAESCDPSAHAEINCIRSACARLHSTQLNALTLYTTGEPCPMCMAAIIHSGISRVIYGVGIETIVRYLPQIRLSSRTLRDIAGAEIEVVGPFLDNKCLPLYEKFR